MKHDCLINCTYRLPNGPREAYVSIKVLSCTTIDPVQYNVISIRTKLPSRMT